MSPERFVKGESERTKFPIKTILRTFVVNEIDFYLEGALRHTPRRSTCTRGPDNLL
jgi:hypothetical protein